jgi:hypothetical protein
MTYAPDTKHPTPGAVGRDIPVETVVARYSGQLYSMPEFEDALFEKTTTGDYAFGLPLAGIEGRLSPLGCPLVVVRRLQRDPLAVPVVRFITLSLSLSHSCTQQAGSSTARTPRRAAGRATSTTACAARTATPSRGEANPNPNPDPNPTPNPKPNPNPNPKPNPNPNPKPKPKPSLSRTLTVTTTRPGFIYLEAVQDIAAGDELFFDYGESPTTLALTLALHSDPNRTHTQTLTQP